MSHAPIIQHLNEQKAKAAKERLLAAAKELKAVCPDLEAQECMDLCTVIMDLEDVAARVKS